MKKYTSIFGQMLQMISRYDFQKAVKQYDAEKHSKGFSSWNHFTALLFAQLAGQDALRGVEAGLASQEKKLYHLGIRSTKRSTLSYANNHRSHEVFQKVFETMLQKTAKQTPGHKFRFKNDIYSFGSAAA
jgi:hypothetical protein